MVSSIVGKRGVPFMGAYSATKFAQVGLAECLRSEVEGSDIHVSVVYPISTATEFTEVMLRETGSAITRSRGAEADGGTGGRRDCARRSPAPCRRFTRTRKSRGLVLLNAIAPGFCDRLVKKFGRQPRKRRRPSQPREP